MSMESKAELLALVDAATPHELRTALIHLTYEIAAAYAERDRVQRINDQLFLMVSGAEHVAAERYAAAKAQLAIMTAVRDEACAIGVRLAGLECDSGAEDRFSQLRAIGQRAEGGGK